MGNIENYKTRFNQLMESTMGDVKPLINEGVELGSLEALQSALQQKGKGSELVDGGKKLDLTGTECYVVKKGNAMGAAMTTNDEGKISPYYYGCKGMRSNEEIKGDAAEWIIANLFKQ